MTVEIYKNEIDAKHQAEDMNNLISDRVFEVAKVTIDQTQADVYGFRFIDSGYQILDSLEVGFILVDDDDWTIEEAGTCGLVAVEA